MTTYADPTDLVDLDLAVWHEVPNQPTDDQHRESLNALLGTWPPPKPMFCDHCGLPAACRQGSKWSAYVHVGGWYSCNAANNLTRPDLTPIVSVDGCWAPGFEDVA